MPGLDTRSNDEEAVGVREGPASVDAWAGGLRVAVLEAPTDSLVAAAVDEATAGGRLRDRDVL